VRENKSLEKPNLIFHEKSDILAIPVGLLIFFSIHSSMESIVAIPVLQHPFWRPIFVESDSASRPASSAGGTHRRTPVDFVTELGRMGAEHNCK
jgi:hypothetical protein